MIIVDTSVHGDVNPIKYISLEYKLIDRKQINI